MADPVNSMKRGLIWAVVLAILGVGLGWVGYSIADQDRMLKARGIEAMAIVTNKSKVRRRGGSSNVNNMSRLSSRGRIEFVVRYQFKAPKGRVTDRKTVSRSFFDSIKFGDSIPLRYMPDKPSINEIESGTISANGMIAMGFGAAFLLAAFAVPFFTGAKKSKFGRGRKSTTEGN